MAGNYVKVKNIILKLNQEELLKHKIIIVGGTVPYLVSKKESNREHSDIDVIVRQENMAFVREYLKREHLSVIDSLDLPYNKQRIDYGADVVIDGIPVNFAPYEVNGDTLVQRNFLVKQSSGIDALATVSMRNVDMDNMFMMTSINGTAIHTYSLEMVKIMKEKSKKKKDAVDIKVIDDFGYDEKNYTVLKEQLKDMQFKMEFKNRLLRYIFH